MLPAIARESQLSVSRTALSPSRRLCSSFERRPEDFRTPSPVRPPALLRFSSAAKTDLRELKLQKLKLNLEVLTTSRDHLKQKQKLLEILERSHRVQMKAVDCRKFSEKQLVSLANVKRRRQLAQTAAIKLRDITSTRRISREVTCQSKREAEAALLIQKQWRRYLVRPTQLENEIEARVRRKYNAATCIQRHIRGYL